MLKIHKDISLYHIIEMTYQTYQVLLTPNGSVGYPNCVLNLITHHYETTLVITHNKTELSSKFFKVIFIERKENNEELDMDIMSCIAKNKPTLIILDHCFQDNNSDFLFDLTYRKQSFLLVNILHTDTAIQYPNVSRLLLASRIDFPLCDAPNHIQQFSKHLESIHLYDFSEPPFYILPTNQPVVQPKTDVRDFEEFKGTTKPFYRTIKKNTVETTQPFPSVTEKNTESQYKIEYHFYKTLMASLQSIIDMELFHGFLMELLNEEINRNADFFKSPICLPLCNLDFLTNFYNKVRFETFTLDMKNKYIQQIQPEIKILLKNDPELLKKISGFFV